MAERNADDPKPKHSILKTADLDDLESDGDASTATDANHPAEGQADDAAGHRHANTPREPITQTRRGFGKLMLGGAAGIFGLSEGSAARDQKSSNWRQGYHQYAKEYVPAFYKSVPSKKNLYRCVKYVAETTNFWETLGKKMYLDQAVVTAAYFYPRPNYKKVEPKVWDGILGDMYADMPKKYHDAGYKRKWPVTVPVVVVYLSDGYYNAVAYLQPYGKSYKSYGYAIKNGYRQKNRYHSKADYESNTWWFTEDGWGDAGTTEGGILDGVPIGLTE